MDLESQIESLKEELGFLSRSYEEVNGGQADAALAAGQSAHLSREFPISEGSSCGPLHLACPALQAKRE